MRLAPCALLFAACTSASADDPGKSPTGGKTDKPMKWSADKMTLTQSGIVGAWIDKSADACTDFYQYACGGFMKTADIPADRSSWGAIQIVQKESEDYLKSVLEDAAKKSSGDATLDKLGAYYAACMDEKAIDKAGMAPIQPMLDKIAKDPVADVVIAMQADGLTPFFQIGPQQDFADATKVIAGIDQAGLGLPDKKYYLDKGGSLESTRSTYQAHMERMFALASLDKKKAANAYQIEVALAKLQQDEVARRDPHAVYHRVERKGLEKDAGSFPWGKYLDAMGIAKVTEISVNEPGYYKAVAKLIKDEKADTIRDYLTWTLLRERADHLGKAWVDESFTMDKELHGVKELPPRWRRCVHRVDRDLGELLGQSYVKAKFSTDAKARAVDLTKQVLGAMRSEIDNLAWMDTPTRAAAKKKLDKMAYLVGYPDQWKKYEFEIKRTDYAGNVQAAQSWEQKRQLAKIGKPVDRNDWGMTPPTVNAYYDPSLNQIVLPAGQLQAPFFGEKFHPAVNFGSTGGGTIGHEMTHGFDDEGSQFDADGNLKDWWSKDTKDKFGDATKCIVEQYGGYEAVPGVKLDGKLTAGENIADNGGVKLAFQAYQSWKTSQKTPVQSKVDDFTDDQLYFLAYAQSWCEKATPQLLETMAHSNPHSPPKWRVNGVIVNQPGFGTAFKCKAGSAMSPGKNCSVW